MNSFELKCYQKTYRDPLYWEDYSGNFIEKKQETWDKCRAMTDSFFDELVTRGYLVPKSNSRK